VPPDAELDSGDAAENPMIRAHRAWASQPQFHLTEPSPDPGGEEPRGQSPRTATRGRVRPVPRLLTLPQLAKRLQIDEEKVCREVEAGRLPHLWLMGEPRFDPVRVNHWLELHECGGDEHVHGDGTEMPTRPKKTRQGVPRGC
jgi:hypothetical protein